MSLLLRFNLLRNNTCSSCPVRFLKQRAGFSSGKLLEPRSYVKRHFTTGMQTLETKITEAASWHKTDSGSCIPAIPPLWLRQTSEHDQSATILVFDIETTGFLHKDNRIIEFALRDLSGGKNCTFETLINPERNVPKRASAVNCISTDLVCRPDIPRFSDVLPVLLAYVRSRQAPGKPVLWVAHNAKQFDAPFLVQEFDRCSAQIPTDWLFVDSLSLARKLVKLKSDGKKHRVRVNLEALSNHYGICSKGPSHRAMPDVTTLCYILQKITFDLKLTYEGLMNESIRASDVRKVS
ncbi:exonuclease DPD1, chloroplastic/mitochondrial-like [Phragmites australis]|uniref:exonuclease DPD1, chloroplastic/mitochondrial-like n=1 Tax=Phragmites australis TaxID=29695 RepID=UPI002D76563C|nr:exonuclease DPD1, chloroplastic/mitochondrial-like [Phragmites australis]